MTDRGDFSRQSFLGEHSEERLAKTRVAIVGLGGGGSHVAQQLAHVGLGEFRLFDHDTIENSNLNRLVTATAEDVEKARRKVEILERTIKSIRPWAKVVPVDKKWMEVHQLLRDVHVVFGCVDSYRARRNLEAACRRFHLPYVDIGMGVKQLPSGAYSVSGQMIMTWPGGRCLTCLGFLTEKKLHQEEDNYGDAGAAPQVVWSNGLLASLAVGAFIQSLTPWHASADEDHIWLTFEGNGQTVAPSLKPRVMPAGPCRHYGQPGTIGDPEFEMPVVF